MARAAVERTLVVKAQGGRHAAFVDLVAGMLDRLHRLARLILRSHGVAADAVQQALVAARVNPSGLRGASG
jgi:DNA-directed RNA polymerase specialized sigma24 family protein